MTALGTDDFRAFFSAVHGQEPFPWQERLARQVLETGHWPGLLDLPTAAGKTAAIDIAVFHLAYEAEKGTDRKAPMRILFVVDRRIVVDEAFRRARKIAEALRGATSGVLLKVKERLAQLSGDASRPLDVVRLRGGVPQERDWARSPAQPLVAVSTVDQVGSRLLFRGYGVSSRMRPVHAGLVGADALWLLDEVHLSQPLSETLAALIQGHAPEGGGVLADRPRLVPFSVVHLSATPGRDATGAFGLADADWANDVLERRLSASKVATLIPADHDLAESFVEQALRLAGFAKEPATANRMKKGKAKAGKVDTSVEPLPEIHRLAVVVNRVNLARQVFLRLQERIAKEHRGQAQVILLTGRVRPLDRDLLLSKLNPFFASPERAAPEQPIILVATQTIEVGADFDFDALVTEIAPLDALRQRFGRLDRLGLRGESRAVILIPAKGNQWQAHDWSVLENIYGGSAEATADWLTQLGDGIDFGIRTFGQREDTITDDLLAPRAQAPVLLPVYADLWATTSPEPTVTPEPALFLHGPSTSADVQVIWRADIDPENEDWANRSLGICPPSSLEAVSVPIWAVSRWLQRAEELPLADVPERTPDEDTGRAGRPCLRRVGDRWVGSYAADLRAGDTIVVPCDYGGCDLYGWNPECLQPVADLGAEAHYRQRRKGALRVTEATLTSALAHTEGLPTGEVWRAARQVIPDEADTDAAAVRMGLLGVEGLPATWMSLLRGMEGRRLRVEPIVPDDPSRGFALWSERRLRDGLLDATDEDEETPGDEAMTGYVDSSAIGVEVGLTVHLAHVEAAARNFARRAGLPESMVALLCLAGRMHDLGKADPRFQADLRGASALARWDPMVGALLAATQGELLAKARQASGRRGPRATPESFRHEALSVALAEKHPAVAQLSQDERDLLLWLVGTHHGWGRPFFPPPTDEAAGTESRIPLDGMELSAAADEAPLRLDQGWFERAERLRRAYGPWELARLEAILRLADHAASADEQEGPSGERSETGP